MEPHRRHSTGTFQLELGLGPLATRIDRIGALADNAVQPRLQHPGIQPQDFRARKSHFTETSVSSDASTLIHVDSL